MKMVKSLLLGTAAGFVAIAGAQAADLPVKAKPVQYVKICSLYGAGFYYIPGTDMCLKIGGWVRQHDWLRQCNGSLTNGPLVANLNTRGTNDLATRTRGYITADARNQTEYGTVRSYIAVGLSAGRRHGTAAGHRGRLPARASAPTARSSSWPASRSVCRSRSSTSTPARRRRSAAATVNPSEDTGDGGKAVTAYTAQFGNGLSASISAEGQRNAGVINANTQHY